MPRSLLLSRYDVLIDGESKKSGSLFDDFEPSINPAEEIDDPNDEKPSDWVENPKWVHTCCHASQLFLYSRLSCISYYCMPLPAGGGP